LRKFYCYVWLGGATSQNCRKMEMGSDRNHEVKNILLTD
jgi:hypothetical protein